ncbi:MAG: amino acid permease [Calditrichaeota bacterium]|nr:amino acid permease [Calditrichota bacterium]
MAQEKKFGTFGGVFTPSILTILGVIMYMRLPWIVGQAGIFTTIGIVLIAHIVSVTTGLSVSSIATDKKVKAGGTYFIISRSLGLPIGGTLGIALFFGLSLSVSLYIIGFSESFLGFWGFPVTKDMIRLTGTIAILFVGTLTFISTSLAIKTQYFIMAAIILSLISILFGNTNFAPEAPLFNSIENMEPLIFLFAIFFPAVTGFEAGVSMSGDLKDPKKSIPAGTISAIVVGLLTYIGLTIFFGYRVNADALVNNPNILLDISFYGPLVVAGIWGATMSSAIGSILGAPRILQATSSDRITPKIFARGFGKTNEPRNALILTFIVAEAGILIGELNLIARVVSMFFITTYGFLNLSSALESWASTDFRPSFRIPAWISITGSLICFILMLELDFVALIGATLIMGAIFLYLKRKELTLESGDTWEGVWSSVLRTGLNRLTRIKKQQRNWRPNIILFSGDSNARPHLLEFGRWLVHKRGILSNFNLLENKNAKHLIPQTTQSAVENEEEFQGIFMRSVEVNDVYEGMETITKVYGFAGIEPNSVMLGWGRNSGEPEKFGRLIHNYSQLDYNIFVLDYEQEFGFGQMKTIDVWWRGGSNSVTLALTLLKFLQASPEWHQARARIFIVSDESALNNKIYKNMIGLLEEQRIDASVKIINNAIEHKPIRDIIKLESKESDLVILGLPEVNPESSAALINNVDTIINDLRTVLLIRASSFFKPIFIGIERTSASPAIKSEKLNTRQAIELPPLELPAHDVLAARFKQISESIEKEFSGYQNNCLQSLQNYNEKLLENIEKLIIKSISETEEILEIKETHRGIRAIAHIQSTFLFNLKKLIQNYKTTMIPDQKDILQSGTEDLLNKLEDIQKEIPAELNVFYERKNDTAKQPVFMRLFKRNKPQKRKIRLHDIFN